MNDSAPCIFNSKKINVKVEKWNIYCISWMCFAKEMHWDCWCAKSFFIFSSDTVSKTESLIVQDVFISMDIYWTCIRFVHIRMQISYIFSKSMLCAALHLARYSLTFIYKWISNVYCCTIISYRKIGQYEMRHDVFFFKLSWKFWKCWHVVYFSLPL